VLIKRYCSGDRTVHDRKAFLPACVPVDTQCSTQRLMVRSASCCMVGEVSEGMAVVHRQCLLIADVLGEGRRASVDVCAEHRDTGACHHWRSIAHAIAGTLIVGCPARAAAVGCRSVAALKVHRAYAVCRGAIALDRWQETLSSSKATSLRAGDTKPAARVSPAVAEPLYAAARTITGRPA
jgi:hypothetical protein